MNHVAVGENETVWRENEPRALAARRSATSVAAELDRYHGGADELYRTDNSLRICVEEFLFVLESFHTY
jgi:hypothetical protein